MKNTLPFLLLLLGACATAGPTGTPLFNGSSLDGWEGNLSAWHVRDGVIVGGSMDGNARNEFLATTQAYSDFVLSLEYKLVGTEGFVNGGVQIRSRRIEKPANEMRGYQADIGAGMSGTLYDESRRNKALLKADPELIKKIEKVGDWNLYEIRSQGPRITLALNGTQTVDFTETEPGMEQDGLIGLQIHGNCKAEISFRNIRITPLR